MEELPCALSFKICGKCLLSTVLTCVPFKQNYKFCIHMNKTGDGIGWNNHTWLSCEIILQMFVYPVPYCIEI